MPTISGGRIIEPGVSTVGTKVRIYHVDGLPTDANIGATAANGMIAANMQNGNIYERQAGVWVRIDTL